MTISKKGLYMTMRARLSLGVLFLSSIIAIAVASQRASATSTDPPTQMDVATAIRLDRDIMHLGQADAEINRIVEQVKPYRADALEILERFKVSMHDFKTGDVTVDYSTGAIHRKSKTDELPTPKR